jgi:hypothetical protein
VEHGIVRVTQQCLRIRAVAGEESNPDTRSNEESMPVDRMWDAQSVEDLALTGVR